MRVGGSGSLTVGEVGRGEAVVHEDTVGFSHFQVDHVRSVFQGSDGVFVGHLLQASTVHLNTERHEELINDNNMSKMSSLRKSCDRKTIFKHEDGMRSCCDHQSWESYSQQLVSDLQPPVFMCSSSLDDLGDIDAVVARDVLVPHSTCYTEAKTCNTPGPGPGPGPGPEGGGLLESTCHHQHALYTNTYITLSRCCQFSGGTNQGTETH